MKFNKVAYLLSGLLISTSLGHAAQTSCPEHFVKGQAPDIVNEKLVAKSREVCYTGYGLLHSGVTRTPLYSAEHLTRDRLMQGKGLKRQSKFHPDDHIPASERAELHHYARSGYDRGHVAPSGDMFDEQSQYESFSLANMIPQEPSVNRGVWEKIESGVRRMAKTRGELFVVTGPLFQGGKLQRIGGAVMVPTAMFKAVYDPGKGEAGAYVVENVEGAAPQIISIAVAEEMSGIRLFPAIGDAVKNKAMRLPLPKEKR
jgi:endonuclease G